MQMTLGCQVRPSKELGRESHAIFKWAEGRKAAWVLSRRKLPDKWHGRNWTQATELT
jgi:hypothetical protein